MIAGTNNDYEVRKEQVLKDRQETKKEILQTLQLHQKLTYLVGQHYAQKLKQVDVHSLTQVGGTFKRDLFINALPWSTTSTIKNGFISQEEYNSMQKRFTQQDYAEIKILEHKRDLKCIMDVMMEEGSTGDVLTKLTDHILQFGAMFLLFHSADKCQEVFAEWEDKLTTDEIDADGTRITKEQELMQNDDFFKTVIRKEDCNCKDDMCEHTEMI